MPIFRPYEIYLIRKIERGFAHSFPAHLLGPRERLTAAKLARRGFVRFLPQRGIYPDRYVVTSKGHWAWGTFDFSTLEYNYQQAA